MREVKNDALKHKIDFLYKNIINLKKLDVDNYFCADMLDWFNEVVRKNISIYKSKKTKGAMDQELYSKERQHVYWVDFGKNVGTEFSGDHFAIVLQQFKTTALVVPVTSKKDHDPKWISDHKDFIVDIGKINGYPGDAKDCYACVYLIHSISKKRLSRFGSKENGYYDLKLDDTQMKLICDKLNEITYNKISY